jgi:hypothetical protein
MLAKLHHFYFKSSGQESESGTRSWVRRFRRPDEVRAHCSRFHSSQHSRFPFGLENQFRFEFVQRQFEARRILMRIVESLDGRRRVDPLSPISSIRKPW